MNGTPNRYDIEQVIQSMVAPELEWGELPLDPTVTFTDMGLDSTGVIALTNGLTVEYGVTVETEEVFDHPTIEQLASRVQTLLQGR